MRLSFVSETVSRQIPRRWFATRTVKFYDNEKSYGFIEEDGIDGDVFCHSRMIAGALSGKVNVPLLRKRDRGLDTPRALTHKIIPRLPSNKIIVQEGWILCGYTNSYSSL
jgi:hypothetical protein